MSLFSGIAKFFSNLFQYDLPVVQQVEGVAKTVAPKDKAVQDAGQILTDIGTVESDL